MIQALGSPPTYGGPRDWVVTSDEPVGTVVARITAHDAEGDVVSFSLQAGSFGEDLSSYFAVDDTGRVTVARPLQELENQTSLIGVVLTDGVHPLRADVRVQIKSPGQKANGQKKPKPTSMFPSIPQRGEGSATNIGPSFILNDAGSPPFLQLPERTLWEVNSSYPLGSFVAQLNVLDITGDPYTFHIEADGLLKVDSKRGNVMVSSSLQKKEGEHEVNVFVRNRFGEARVQVILLIHPDPGNKMDAGITTENTTGANRPDLDTSASPNLPQNRSTQRPTIVTLVNNVQGEVIQTSTSSPMDPPSSDGINLTVIPVVMVVGLIPLLLAAFCFWRKRRREAATAKESTVIYTDKNEEDNNYKSSAPSADDDVEGETSLSPLTSVFSIWHKKAELNKYENEISTNSSISARKISDISDLKDSWEFPRHRLRILGILGEGSFGQVWKCEAKGLQEEDSTMFVAVKTLKESAGESDRKDLRQELNVFKSLGRHPHVVSLLGCCTEREPIFIILEYMVGGKLQSYLRASRADATYGNLHGTSSSLSPKDLTKFAFQTARGMEYLSENGIIHRDLAARNILVGEDKICKVSDFGFSRDVTNNHVYERKSDGRLPIRWMAPESLFDNIFTTKSDVWSFGVLLWEIVTLGSTPYPGTSANEVMRKIKEGYRLEKPEHCRREIYNIMYYCWHQDPKGRPSFVELVATLEGLLLSEVDYIQLDNFPDHSYYNVILEQSGELL